MSLPYLNEGKTTRHVNTTYNAKTRAGQNRVGMNMLQPGDEARTLEARPISNPTGQMRNTDGRSGSRARDGFPQPQYSMEHSDVIARINSEGSTVSEIHHHVHHHYNHTHIHHHHNISSGTGNTTSIMTGAAAVPSAVDSTTNINAGKSNGKQVYGDN
jgi:hypothetical protein